MRYANSRSGFTIIELVIASSIAVIVFSALGSTMLFCQRMMREAMAEADLTLALREVRDKLLFHAVPGSDIGLLSGKIEVDTASIRLANVNSVRLISERFAGTDKFRSGYYLFNEWCPNKDNPVNKNWFRPHAGSPSIHDDERFPGFLLESSIDTTTFPRITLKLMSPDKSISAVNETLIILPQSTP